MLSAADLATLAPLHKALDERQHEVMEAFFKKHQARGTLSQLLAADCYAMGRAYWSRGPEYPHQPDYLEMIRLMEEGVRPDRFDPINSSPCAAAYYHKNVSALALLFWFADGSPLNTKLELNTPEEIENFNRNTALNAAVREMYRIRQVRHAAAANKSRRLFHEAVVQFREVLAYCQKYEALHIRATETDPSTLPVLRFFQKQLNIYRYEVFRCLQQIDAQCCISTSADTPARHKAVLEELADLAGMLSGEDTNAPAYRARAEKIILPPPPVAPVASRAALPPIPEDHDPESDDDPSAVGSAGSVASVLHLCNDADCSEDPTYILKR